MGACTNVQNNSVHRTEGAALTEQLDSLLSSRTEEGFEGSVLVSRSGDVVLHKTYGSRSTASSQAEPAYWIASGTKQFTGALISVLADEGAIEIDARIGRYIDDVPSDKHRITIRQLLTNTSGLGQSYVAEGIADRDTALRSILSTKLVAQPGQKYSYSNDGFTLLAIIAEAVTGESYEELMRSRLLDPAGMTRTEFWGFEGRAAIASVPHSDALVEQSEAIYRDGKSIENWGYRGATGILSTTRDLHSWLVHVMSSRGQPDNALSQVLQPEQFIREVHGVGSVSYGFGLAVVERDGRLNMVTHIGDDDWLSHNSTVSAYVDGDIIVVLSNSGYLPDGTPWSAAVTSDIRSALSK